MNYNEMAMERHTGTLKRLLAIVLVYIGVADDDAQALRFIGRTASDWDAGDDRGADAVARAFAAMGDPGVISRRLHGMIRKLLLPMEAATRRLIVVLATELPDPKIVPSMLKVRRRVASTAKLIALPRTWQSGIMVPRFLQPQPALPPLTDPKLPVRIPRFALLDPLKRFGRRRSIRNTCPPRIAGLGEDSVLSPIPVYTPQSPWDQVPDVHLMRRVTALAHALDDLPRQALRFAGWRALSAARRAAGLRGRGKFLVPRDFALRSGKPPGAPAFRKPEDRYSEEEALVTETNRMARYALGYYDTS